MRRIADSRNPSKDKFGQGKNGFKPGDPAGTDQPSVPGYEWFDSVQEEIANVIEATGIALDPTKYTQLLAAIRRLSQKPVILTDTGAVNAYTATNTPSLVKADLTDGLMQLVRIATTNNGAATYSPDAIGGDPILGLGLQPLQGGELFAGGVAVLFRETITTVNAGKSFWLLMGCAGGVQPVAPAIHDQHAMQLGQFTSAPLSFRNLLTNGAMRVAQQYGTTLQTPTDSTFVLDQWTAAITQTGKLTFQKVNGPNSFGFDAYAQITTVAAYAPVASDYFIFQQQIEAQILAALQWGTANATPASLQFVVNSSLTGTFSGSLRNSDGTRSYPFTFSIPTANTDTQITIPNIPGDTAGTWVLTGVGGGMYVRFDLGCGSTYRGSAGAWQAGNYIGVTGTQSVVATAGATFKVTGVQLEAGPVCTKFERPTPEAEMARCQHYLPAIVSGGSTSSISMGFAATTTQFSLVCQFRVPTRVPITGIAISSPGHATVYTAGLSFTPNAAAFTRGSVDACVITLSCTGLTANSGGDAFFNNAQGKLLFLGAQL